MSAEAYAAIISGCFAILVVGVQLWVHRGNKLSNGYGHEIRADVRDIKDDVRDIKDDMRDIKDDMRDHEHRLDRLETP